MSQPAARCCATPQSHDGTDADDASDESSGAESDGDGDMFDGWHSERERRSVRAVLGVDESRAPDDMQALLRVSMRARVGWPPGGGGDRVGEQCGVTWCGDRYSNTIIWKAKNSQARD